MPQVAAAYTTKPHIRTTESVIEAGFLEALQRDPTQHRQWLVLIDSLPHQIRLINRIMEKLNVKVTIIMDFIYVLEFVWKAACKR